MNEADKTPLPIAVEVPPDRDSNSQFSMEVAEVSGEKARTRRVQSSRTLTKALLFSGVVSAALVGKYAVYQANEAHQRDVEAGIAEVKKGEDPRFLSAAKLDATKELYPDEEGKADVKAARQMLDKATEYSKHSDWQLPIEQFMSPDQVKISEDGRSFEWEGKSYSFGRITEEDGDVYVLASRSYEEDNLILPDRTHMVSPILVGGAKFETGFSEDEMNERATANARERLEGSLEKYKAPVRYIREASGNIIVAATD